MLWTAARDHIILAEVAFAIGGLDGGQIGGIERITNPASVKGYVYKYKWNFSQPENSFCTVGVNRVRV